MDRLISQIDNYLKGHKRVLIAIDGPCTSGKTTLAARLAERYDCNVFHMDDFFLRPEQRTAERYAESGGNVDYERFWGEVLIPLQAGSIFSYRPFDCKILTFSKPVFVNPKKLNIIEGSYSHHPYFEDAYDLRVFLSITPELQRQRVLERPAPLHQRFFDEWIPMENRYFEAFDIPGKSDIVIETSLR